MNAHDTPGHASAPRQPQFIQLHHEDTTAIRRELLAGLSAAAAHIAPKYLYDPLGSRLFEAITELTEYYPTRTEAAIFRGHLAQMAAVIGPGSTLIDLGAGNCEKAARLFQAFQPAQYVAVDISADYLRQSLDCLQRQFPALAMVGVGMDFSASLRLPPQIRADKPVFFYPGSSIGNFTPDEALVFLRQIRQHAGGGGLLIGVDLVKPKSVLDPAYDDALGVTAAFNLNLLLHVNRLAGTNFRVQDWRHIAYFSEARSRIEMYLEAQRTVTVHWSGGERRFHTGDRIHTENSYKYRPEDFDRLLRDSGFSATHHWTDAHGWFAVFWAHA